MRKPLVVVCVGASAVLLAGAIAATAAGADTAPGTPQAPALAVPALPADEPPAQQPPAQQPPAQQPPAQQPPAQQPPAAGPGAPDVPPLPEPADEPAAEPAPDDDPPRRPGTPATPAADPVRPAPATSAPDRDAPARPKPGRPAARPDAPAGGASSSSVQPRVLTLVNENRRRGGCDDLTTDRRLVEAADRHAADMARRGYFAHRSPGGEDAGDRVQDAGYRWKRYGENIARGQDSADEVVEGWMNSPSHRENIMDCDLHQMGVGLAYASDRTPYWVQNFATPR